MTPNVSVHDLPVAAHEHNIHLGWLHVQSVVDTKRIQLGLPEVLAEGPTGFRLQWGIKLGVLLHNSPIPTEFVSRCTLEVYDVDAARVGVNTHKVSRGTDFTIAFNSSDHDFTFRECIPVTVAVFQVGVDRSTDFFTHVVDALRPRHLEHVVSQAPCASRRHVTCPNHALPVPLRPLVEQVFHVLLSGNQ